MLIILNKLKYYYLITILTFVSIGYYLEYDKSIDVGEIYVINTKIYQLDKFTANHILKFISLFEQSYNMANSKRD